ncbi:MAG: hypothetical protein ACI9QV_001226, partial [Methylophagaceae bacterium]
TNNKITRTTRCTNSDIQHWVHRLVFPEQLKQSIYLKLMRASV